MKTCCSTLYEFSLLGCVLILSSGTALAISYEGSGPRPSPSSNGFQFNDSSRWSSTVTDGGGLGQGDPTTPTWSFVPDGTSISGGVGEPASNSSLISFLDGELDPGSTGGADLTQRSWFPIFNDSFSRFQQLSGLTLVYEPNDDGNANGGIDGSSFPFGSLGTRGDVRIGGHFIDGQVGSNILAYNYFPNHGDMVLDTGNIAFYSAGNTVGFRNTIMHEHGHGVGISHVEPVNQNKLMEPFISTIFEGPQLDDILAIHRGYGDVNEKSNSGAGNEISTNATSLGSVNIGSTVTVGADADPDVVVVVTDVDFVSIDDNSDIDCFKFSVATPATIDALLTPLGPTYNQGPQDGIDDNELPFNSAAQSDLSLELFDLNGMTSLGFANNTGVGQSESLSDISLLAAGTYFAKVTGTANTVQLYQLDITGTTVIPEPTTLLLAALGQS